MNNRALLVTGLIAMAASVIGPNFQTSPTGGWWGWHHGHSGMHHGWVSGVAGASPAVEGAETVTVTAAEFGFEPDVVTVEAGTPVNLTLVNTGAIAHDLAIPAFGVRIDAGAGEQATAGFTPTDAGTFEIVCTYPGHAGAGMTAELVVEPAG